MPIRPDAGAPMRIGHHGGHDDRMILLVPGDPLRPRRPDSHFAPEAAAARQAGGDVAVIDHDALSSAGSGAGEADRAVSRVAPTSGDGSALYRGWMLRSEQYAVFADALARREVRLLTGADRYRRAHELPGWYPSLVPFTPVSAWTVGSDPVDVDRIRRQLGAGPAVLRDYTKSLKHYWHEAAFIPDLADARTTREVVERFLHLREDDFVGGCVLRRFEPLAPAEVRTWWVGGTCILSGPHPDTPDDLRPTGPDLSAIAPAVAGLDLRFVTVDLALRTDGVWRVVELGDGQVSDRPSTMDPARFIRALDAALAQD